MNFSPFAKLKSYAQPLAFSYCVVSILNALLVILKEKNATTVKEFMKAATSHHWISHGVIVIVLFFGLGYAFSFSNKVNKLSDEACSWLVLGSTVLSALIMMAFFGLHG